ncbi:eukaryotic translation initiation factor 3 subunit A [Gonapodya sp. JEL0774]|nr:eukaryotic translation initiation factor 3 subunit A [Gonapodya sp. JEL0774]
MPQPHQENAVKRAEDLLAVNQPKAALDALYESLMSKRSRSIPITSLEPIAIRFVELCVELRQAKQAKEGLHQYKNVAQNTSVATIETVITRFIELAESKVASAQARADAMTLETVEDLDATETPESVLMSAVSGEQGRDRTDREVVTPWLKFLWESYRTAMDILRNNARLEVLYQHLTLAAKYQSQSHAVNLSDPETLQRHLDTRFAQLNAAADLELWQEAFRSVEDVHNLLSMSKKQPKPYMMANYYEKLAKIFLVGDNYLFHAAAGSRHYNIVKAGKNQTDEEVASVVLVSMLAIPIITTAKSRLDFDDKSRTQRLTSLLRATRAPTREGLLKEALSRNNILSRVRPEVRELYNILEVQFHPLSICKRIAPVVTSLAKQPELAKYIKPLLQVVLTRLLQQLSQVYTTVKIDFLVELLSLPPPYSVDAVEIERFIMNGCRKGELSIRVDHRTNSITFEADPFESSKGSISEGPRLQSLPSEQMRLQVVRLAKRLHAVVGVIDPESALARRKETEEAARMAAEAVEEEKQLVAERISLIEKKKEKRETEAARKDQEKQREQALQKKKEAEAERIRLAEEEKRRERERIDAAKAQIVQDQAAALKQKLAAEMKDKKVKGIDQTKLDTLDADALMELQRKQAEQQQRDLQTKLRTTQKRIDHTERAFREEERPLLLAKQEEISQHVAESRRKAREQQIAEARQKFEEGLADKARLARIMMDYGEFRSAVEARTRAEFDALKEEVAREMEEAKNARREEVRLKAIADRKRKKQEEADRKKKEEQERARREEEERLASERADKLAREKAERAERDKKLNEQAAKQREREREAEEKLRARDAELKGDDGQKWKRVGADASGSSGTTPWRRAESARATTDDQASPSPGIWRRNASARGAGDESVPSARREEGGNSMGPSWKKSDSGRGTVDPGRERESPREREGGEGGGTTWRRNADRTETASADRRPLGRSGGDDPDSRFSTTTGGSSGKYVPPSKRGAAADEADRRPEKPADAERPVPAWKRSGGAGAGANALLIEAIERGDLNAAKDALERGARPDVSRKRITVDVEMPDGSREAESSLGESALAVAVRDGRSDIVEALLEAGANPNAPITWKIANVNDFWSPDNWDDGNGAWDDDNLTFQSALEFALTSDRWPFNPPGADVTIENPFSDEQVCRWMDVQPRTEIVALLLRHGAKVGDEERKAAKAFEGDGADEIRRLVESHAPPEPKVERGKRVIGPSSLGRQNSAPIQFTLGLFNGGQGDRGKLTPLKEEESTTALTALEEKQRKEIVDLKKKLRDLHKSSTERDAEQKLLVKSQRAKIAELAEMVGDGPGKKMRALEDRLETIEAEHRHIDGERQRKIAELEERLQEQLEAYQAHLDESEKLFADQLAENHQTCEELQHQLETKENMVTALEAKIADITSSLLRREEEHALELASIAEASSRKRSEAVDFEELQNALRESEDIIAVREAEHQRRVSELEWTLRGQSETFTRREEELQRAINDLERALRDQSFFAHTKEKEQGVRIAELERVISERTPTYEERETELLARIRELEESMRFEVTAQRERDRENERTISVVLEREIEKYRMVEETIGQQLAAANREIQHLQERTSQLELLVAERDQQISVLGHDAGRARTLELDQPSSPSVNGHARNGKYATTIGESFWNATLTPAVNGLLVTTPRLGSPLPLSSVGSISRRQREKHIPPPLPPKRVLKVLHPFTPQKKDEIALSPGDDVVCIFEHNDGWCAGTNRTTAQSGTFPRGCLASVQLSVSELSPTPLSFPERCSSLGRHSPQAIRSGKGKREPD